MKKYLAYMGYSLFLVWFMSVEATGSISSDLKPADLYHISMLFFDALALIVVACLYRRIGALRTRPALYKVIACLIAVSGLGSRFLGLESGSDFAFLAPVIGICTGLSLAVLALMWMEAFSALNMRSICLVFSAATILGTVLRELVKLIPADSMALIGAVFGVLSALLAVRAKSPDGPAADLSDEAQRYPASFPVQPVVLMMLYALTYSLCLGFINQNGFATGGAWRNTVSLIANSVAPLLVIALAVSKSQKFDIKILYGLALPAMCMGLALAIGPFENFAAAGMCVHLMCRLGFSCFSLFLYIVLFNISFRWGVSPLWLFGFSRATRVIVTFAAQTFLASGIADDGVIVSAILAVLLVVLVALSSLISMGKGYDTTWGIRILDGPHSGELSAQVAQLAPLTLAERCSRAAYLYGLTKREEEVLILLAEGKNVPDIERELVVSNGTARVHVQHLYKKLDIHSREELRAFMDSPDLLDMPKARAR